MYLVTVTVDTPGWRAPTQDLRVALHAGKSGADGLQHVWLHVEAEAVVFSLYVQARNVCAAIALSDQLCRRTMVTVSQARRWTVTSAMPNL
jgi:hypothetical protein